MPPDASYPPDIIFIVRRDGTIVYVNWSLPAVPGGDVLGTSVYSYTATAHHDAVRTSLERVFASGEADGYECSGVAPFTAGAWYQCRVAPNKREGRVVSATIIARDMTGWQGAQDGLRTERDQLSDLLQQLSDELATVRDQLAHQDRSDSERARFRTILDQAGEAIFLIDPNTGRLVDANETACRWLGRGREQLLSMRIHDLNLEFSVESPNGVADHVTDTRYAPRPWVFTEGVHRRRNGTSFPVEVAIARGRFDDRDYLLIVARDIKQRRRIDEAVHENGDNYRSLFELSRDAIYLSARDGTVVEVNEAAIDLFGYSRAEIIGLEARNLYMEPRDIRAFQERVEEAGSVRDLPVEFRAKNGARIDGLLTVTHRRAGDGGILGYQCVVRPRVDSDRAEPAPEQPAERVSALVIDGEKRLLTEVRTVLERVGLAVLATRTGTAGVEVFRSQSDEIAVVLLGVNIEEPDFTDTIAEIRCADPRVPVILMVEDSDRDALDRLAGLDRVDTIRKPIHPLALAQHVRDAVGTRQLS